MTELHGILAKHREARRVTEFLPQSPRVLRVAWQLYPYNSVIVCLRRSTKF